MRLAQLVAPERFELIDVPVPQPGPAEVLVQVAACGVCSSELSTWTGRAPTTFPARIGHEVSGTVVESRGSTLVPGERVAVWTTGSGFAEYVAVAEEYCRPLGGLDPVLGLLEPVACAVNAVELADVRLGDDVVILGAGYMGLLVQQLVQLRGPRRVVVVDRRADVLRLAESLGADRTVDARVESPEAVVEEVTGGRGADVCFEVTGSQSALEQLGALTRMSGKLVLVGFHQGEPRQIPLGHWNWMAYDLRNAHFRDVATIMRGMDVGMRLLDAGRLNLGPLVTHRFPLDRIDDAFRTAVGKPGGFVKAVVTVPDAR